MLDLFGGQGLDRAAHAGGEALEALIAQLPEGDAAPAAGPLQDKTVVLTGSLEAMTRDQAGERLGSVTQRIGEIDGMNQSVATATEEQTAVIESLNMDITEINTLNQQGVENLQSTLRACGDLDQQARRLKQLVDSFRI